MKTNIFKRKAYANPSATAKDSDNNEHDEVSVHHMKPNVPEGIMVKCRACGKVIYIKTIEKV